MDVRREISLRKGKPERPMTATRRRVDLAETSDGYPRDLERVLPASALALFEESRRWFGHSVRPLDPPPEGEER